MVAIFGAPPNRSTPSNLYHTKNVHVLMQSVKKHLNNQRVQLPEQHRNSIVHSARGAGAAQGQVKEWPWGAQQQRREQPDDVWQAGIPGRCIASCMLQQKHTLSAAVALHANVVGNHSVFAHANTLCMNTHCAHLHAQCVCACKAGWHDCNVYAQLDGTSGEEFAGHALHRGRD